LFHGVEDSADDEVEAMKTVDAQQGHAGKEIPQQH
jgi:hypothetical protein